MNQQNQEDQQNQQDQQQNQPDRQHQQEPHSCHCDNGGRKPRIPMWLGPTVGGFATAAYRVYDFGSRLGWW